MSGAARVYGDAWVYGAARVSGAARVYGAAKITKTVINLIGVCNFNVTMYGKFLQIGCYLHTLKEWGAIFKDRKYTDETSAEDYKNCEAAYNFCKGLSERGLG